MKKIIFKLVLLIILVIALVLSMISTFAKSAPITYEPEETIFVPAEDYWEHQWKYV